MQVASRAQRGFSLFELMITLAVAGTLAAIAVPNMRDFMRNSRLSTAANDMLRSMQVARSEAIKRQRIMAVCATANPDATDPTCSGGAMTGWIVFQDTNASWDRDAGEEVIDRKRVPANVTVRSNNTGKVSYNTTGFASSTPGQTPMSRVVLCDVRGNLAVGQNSVARGMWIEPTGRARITRAPAEITAALTTIGSTCP